MINMAKSISLKEFMQVMADIKIIIRIIIYDNSGFQQTNTHAGYI